METPRFDWSSGALIGSRTCATIRDPSLQDPARVLHLAGRSSIHSQFSCAGSRRTSPLQATDELDGAANRCEDRRSDSWPGSRSATTASRPMMSCRTPSVIVAQAGITGCSPQRRFRLRVRSVIAADLELFITDEYRDV
jgi:hypothetical protein